MSKPKSPKPKSRRLLLSTVLATGLSAAAGVGGYLLWNGEKSELSETARQDLDAGFESAQTDGEQNKANDTLSGLASAWNRETDPQIVPAAAQLPAPTTPDLETLPELPTGDRYQVSDVTPPLTNADDQYAAEPADDLLANSSSPQAEEQVEAAVTDEPHAASDVIARGQSPFGALPPVAEPPAKNPLRRASHSADAAASLPNDSAQAEAAFAEPAPMPMPIQATGGEGRYQAMVGPEPATTVADNPLRGAAIDAQPSVGFEAGPEDASRAALPQPTNESPYGREPAAIASLEPTPAAESAVAGNVATGNIASEPIAPLPEPGYNPRALSPTPSADFGSTPAPITPRGTAIDQGTGRPGERALEGPQRPSLVLQKFAPEEIQVGKECKFVIKVRNIGQRPADNVVVEDEVPQGARYLAASPQAEPNGSNIVWRLGTLSPGEERTMEVELMPTDEGEIGSVAKVSFASHVSAKSRCTRPQLALRMTAPGEVMIGRQQRLTIELHNPGTGDATGVILTENVPENVSHQAGPALEFEVGTLRAGETRRMELVLSAEKPGSVTNVLTARADGNLQVQQEVQFEVISPALAVEVNGPSRRYLERPATYTVNVDNPGTAPAKDIQLVTKLPRGMQFVRANNLGEYDSATHSVYWSLAELPEGQQGSVELVALPVQSGDHTIEVEGRAREGLEDRTTQPVRVEGLAAIMFEVSDAQDPIEVGGTTSYDVRVVNQGSKAASNVQVTALVPPGMAVTNAQGETRHAIEAEGVVFEPLARLAPKADTVYRIEVQGVRPGDQRLMVEVRTDDLEQPIRKEESTRVFGDE